MSPGSARYGLTSRLAVAAMAGYGLAWPRACGRWLPVWLRAPRGALSYSPRSGRRLEEVSVGLMAYLDP